MLHTKDPLGSLFTRTITPKDIASTLDPDNLGIQVADRQIAQYNPSSLLGAIGDMGQASRILALQEASDADAMAKNARLRILGSLAPAAIQMGTGINLRSAERSRNRVMQLVDQFLPQVAEQKLQAFKAAQKAPLEAAIQAAKVAGEAQKFNAREFTQGANTMATAVERAQTQEQSRDMQKFNQALQVLRVAPETDDKVLVAMGLDQSTIDSARDEHRREASLDARRVAISESRGGVTPSQAATIRGNVRKYSEALQTAQAGMMRMMAKSLMDQGAIESESALMKKLAEDPILRQEAATTLMTDPTTRREFERLQSKAQSASQSLTGESSKASDLGVNTSDLGASTPGAGTNTGAAPSIDLSKSGSFDYLKSHG